MRLLNAGTRSSSLSFAAFHAANCSATGSRGGIPSKFAFDLRVTSPLPSAAVLAVHTEGQPAFEGMGRRYPAGFVDTDIGRWKELTGKDD
jgi:hypothetical protein